MRTQILTGNGERDADLFNEMTDVQIKQMRVKCNSTTIICAVISCYSFTSLGSKVIRMPTHCFLTRFLCILMTGVPALLVPATIHAQQLQYPIDVAVADDGTLFIADLKLPGIWKVAGGEQEIYFQASKKFRTPLNAVRCLAIDKNGHLIAGDSATREVYRFDGNDKPVPLTKGTTGIPAALVVDSEGDLFVSDLETQRIWRIDAETGETEEHAVIPAVRGLSINEKGEMYLVCTRKDQVRVFRDGEFKTVVAERPFEFPHHADWLGETLLVADNYAVAIWQVTLQEEGTGEVKHWLQGKPLVKPVGLTVFKDAVYVADPHAKKVFRFETPEKFTVVAQ